MTQNETMTKTEQKAKQIEEIIPEDVRAEPSDSGCVLVYCVDSSTYIGRVSLREIEQKVGMEMKSLHASEVSDTCVVFGTI